jgi:CIC family chloride channel protein
MEHTGDPAAAGESARDDGDPLPSGLVRLTVLALIGGALTGLVGGLFRLALAGAELLRTDVLEWAREAPAVRWVLPVILAAGAAALARLIVRWDPDASGSGVQRVEAVVRGQLEPDRRLRLIPAKFVGGVLAIGSGMALGREGPTVQMGASIGQEIARVTRLSAQDRGSLTASLGGAGLGVAFSAPLGGAVFVFEELTGEFRTRLVVAVLAGTATAMAVSHYLVGWDAVFPVPSVETGAMWQLIVYAAFGLVVGLLGVAYNRLVLLLLDAFASVHRLPPEVKAGFGRGPCRTAGRRGAAGRGIGRGAQREGAARWSAARGAPSPPPRALAHRPPLVCHRHARRPLRTAAARRRCTRCPRRGRDERPSAG